MSATNSTSASGKTSAKRKKPEESNVKMLLVPGSTSAPSKLSDAGLLVAWFDRKRRSKNRKTDNIPSGTENKQSENRKTDNIPSGTENEQSENRKTDNIPSGTENKQVVALAMGKSGKFVVYVQENGMCSLIDLSNYKIIQHNYPAVTDIFGEIEKVKLSARNARIVEDSTGTKFVVLLWHIYVQVEVGSGWGRSLGTMGTKTAVTKLRSACYKITGSRLVFGAKDGNILVQNDLPADIRTARRHKHSPRKSTDQAKVGQVTSLCFIPGSANSPRLLTGCSDGVLRLWENNYADVFVIHTATAAGKSKDGESLYHKPMKRKGRPANNRTRARGKAGSDGDEGKDEYDLYDGFIASSDNDEDNRVASTDDDDDSDGRISTTIPPAHQSAVLIIRANSTGTVVATVSPKDKVIHLWKVADWNKIPAHKQLSGSDIAFNSKSTVVAVLHEDHAKRTAHIFAWNMADLTSMPFFKHSVTSIIATIGFSEDMTLEIVYFYDNSLNHSTSVLDEKNATSTNVSEHCVLCNKEVEDADVDA